MPWETIAHRCKRPMMTLAPALGGPPFGSVWRCDECGKRWEFTPDGFREIKGGAPSIRGGDDS